MTTPPEAAGRRRPTWAQLPAPVRAAVETHTGTVTSARSCDGGYSQGLASVLTTAGGDRVFVKAVGAEHGFTQHLYREEARRHALLPAGAPAPALRWSERVEDDADDPWEVIAFDAAAGRTPVTPWRDDELAAVVALSNRIGELDVAAGTLPEYADETLLDFWAKLAGGDGAGLDTYDPWVRANLGRCADLDAHIAEAVQGEHLVHADLRGDNVLLDPAAADLAPVAVDWPYAARGAAFVNLVGLLPSVRLEGGPTPQDVLARHPLPADTDPEAVTAFLAGMTGYFVHSSLQPPPAGIPHVRAFQRAQAEVCIPWLRQRLGC